MSDEIRETDGLYYPYINVHDDNWLKVSLLYFPHIIRMVPANYETNPTDFMRVLSETRGARDEPLLGSYSLRSYTADDAIDRLTFRLVEDAQRDPRFAERFSMAATIAAYNRSDLFQIHKGKAPQHFWEELSKRRMMWQAPYRVRGSIELDEEWVSLNPLLGEAFMATVATAVASEKGMDIVTDGPGFHSAVVCRDENVIYDTLIKERVQKKRRRIFRLPPTIPEMTFHVAHLILVSNFDVSRLNAKDLSEMSINREALFDFRRELARRISAIPPMTSEMERERRLKAVAQEAMAEWRKALPTFSRFSRRFFGLGLLDKSERAMTDLAKAMIPGSLTGAALIPSALTGASIMPAKAVAGASLLGAPLIAAGPGLAVAVAVYGIKTWQGLKDDHLSGPLRYLSLLKKQGATLLIAAPPEAESDPRLR